MQKQEKSRQSIKSWKRWGYRVRETNHVLPGTWIYRAHPLCQERHRWPWAQLQADLQAPSAKSGCIICFEIVSSGANALCAFVQCEPEPRGEAAAGTLWMLALALIHSGQEKSPRNRSCPCQDLLHLFSLLVPAPGQTPIPLSPRFVKPGSNAL